LMNLTNKKGLPLSLRQKQTLAEYEGDLQGQHDLPG
jgi:hypothetical protein